MERVEARGLIATLTHPMLTNAEQELLIDARREAELCAELVRGASENYQESVRARFWDVIAESLADVLPKPEPVVVRVPKEDLAQNQGIGYDGKSNDELVTTLACGKVLAETEKGWLCEFGGRPGARWLPKSQVEVAWDNDEDDDLFEWVRMPRWLAARHDLAVVEDYS